MKPLSDAKPLPCPFCGKPPRTGERYFWCLNRSCPAKANAVSLTIWNRRASSASAGTLTHEDLRILTMVIEDNMEVYTDERQKKMKAISDKLAALADAPTASPTLDPGLTREDWSDIRSALINAADRTPFAAREKRWRDIASKLAALADKEREGK